MLSTLVDNSTLTSVQRLIGDVPVAFSFAAEGDISAYDQYLQSLLLYDEVAAIDDYKAEYKLERKSRFREVRFLDPSQVPYEEATQHAIQSVSDFEYEIRRGRLAAGPISDFLSSLDLHVLPAWYMQSSNWLLNLRILADESNVDAPKYGALTNIIQAQTSQGDRCISPVKNGLSIETRDGILLDNDAKGDGSIDNDVKRFSMGLNWIAQRSAFYTLMASRLNSAYTLHPIRHAFAIQYLLKSMTHPLEANIRAGVLKFFANQANQVRKESDDLVFPFGTQVSLPFFAAWAVGHAGNPRNGYDHVLQIRYGKEATTLRSRFREIESLAHRSDYSVARREAASLRRAIQEDLVALRQQFTGLSKNDVVDVSIDALSLSPSVSLGGLLKKLKDVSPNSEHRAVTVLRDISSDFMRMPTLGEVSDRFYISRKIRKGTEFVPDRTRVEAKKWQHASSHWKRPV